MLLRRFADFILRRPINAMGAVFILTFIPFGGLLSIIIATLVTLRRGAYVGTLVFMAATLPIFLMSMVYPAGNPIALAGFVLCNLITWVLALLLRQYGKWNWVIESALLLGIVAVGLVHALYPDVQQWWGTQLSSYYTRLFSPVDGLMKVPADSNSADAVAQMVANTKIFATGLFTAFILLNAVLQLLLARWWQAIVFNPGGLQTELYEIRLSSVLSLLFIGCLSVAYAGVPVAQDMLPVFFVGFFAAGLSLVHCLLAKRKMTKLWLLFLYAMIVVVEPFSVMALAFLALADTFIDFRGRLRKSL